MGTTRFGARRPRYVGAAAAMFGLLLLTCFWSEGSRAEPQAVQSSSELTFDELLSAAAAARLPTELPAAISTSSGDAPLLMRLKQLGLEGGRMGTERATRITMIPTAGGGYITPTLGSLEQGNDRTVSTLPPWKPGEVASVDTGAIFVSDVHTHPRASPFSPADLYQTARLQAPTMVADAAGQVWLAVPTVKTPHLSSGRAQEMLNMQQLVTGSFACQYGTTDDRLDHEFARLTSDALAIGLYKFNSAGTQRFELITRRVLETGPQSLDFAVLTRDHFGLAAARLMSVVSRRLPLTLENLNAAYPAVTRFATATPDEALFLLRNALSGLQGTNDIGGVGQAYLNLRTEWQGQTVYAAVMRALGRDGFCGNQVGVTVRYPTGGLTTPFILNENGMFEATAVNSNSDPRNVQ